MVLLDLFPCLGGAYPQIIPSLNLLLSSCFLYVLTVYHRECIIGFHHVFRFWQICKVLRRRWNCTLGNDESTFVSQINNISTFVLTISFKDSHLLLIELMFNCAHIKRLTFARRKFFKIVLAQSGESVKSIFFAGIDSHSRLMFKVLVDELPVHCIFNMRNTAFFLFDSFFFWVDFKLMSIRLGQKIKNILQKL